MSVIVVDAMGGDNCPDCNVEGAIDAVKESESLVVVLAGPENKLKEMLTEMGYEGDRIRIVNADEVISTEESPVMAIRKKKDSSLVKGISELKEGRADAFVSAGSSGAVLAAGQLLIGRLNGVLRPPLGSLIPTKKGVSFFLDMGANVDASPEWLLQFADMGTIYMREVMGISSPEVKLLNIGLEEEKGNKLTKEANELMKADSRINYKGYCEAREVPFGAADVIVADAFTGNAVIKTFEGTAGLFLSLVKQVFKSSVLTKLGALLVMKPFKETLKSFDTSTYGGAPLLGIKSPVFKCHGNATRKEIRNAILQADSYVEKGVNEIIAKAFEKV